ncbi:MAG: acetolactate synthase large subunit [Hyphomicrobiales bacterium]|nr:MAG: acetolactate synthase large subunit [Hyphomicrobiales bacterium]
MPNGAKAMMRTLANAGVTVCFTNPGTSEMHFVAALDSVPEMRAVLCLFEGVATGAADGYARMADRPAATLLHLGCGLGNGLANLHNARKARVPVINVVGDHATFHVQYDAQLQSDIETVARNVSPGFVRTSRTTAQLCRDVLDAVTAAAGPPGQVATLIVPADVSWGEGAVAEPAPQISAFYPAADDAAVLAIASTIAAGGRNALLLGGTALRETALLAAARIAARCGIKIFAETFPARMERGAGMPSIERIAYLAEMAAVQLNGIDNLILVDAKAPVSFFAYPQKRSYLVPAGCKVHMLSTFTQDAAVSLEKLCKVIDADQAVPRLVVGSRPSRPRGKRLTAEKVCKAVGHLLPDNAIVVDEAISSGLMLGAFTEGAPRHDLITLTGGAIGQGLPNALGAAIACPDRRVLALIGDGASMYTFQTLWTLARENLNVTAIIFNNASYAVLNLELERVGADNVGSKAKAQLDLSGPVLNFAHLAAGMGVHGVRATSTEEFMHALEHALATPGPHVIEAMVPPTLAGLRLRLLPHILGSLEHMPLAIARMLKRKIAP